MNVADAAEPAESGVLVIPGNAVRGFVPHHAAHEFHGFHLFQPPVDEVSRKHRDPAVRVSPGLPILHVAQLSEKLFKKRGVPMYVADDIETRFLIHAAEAPVGADVSEGKRRGWVKARRRPAGRTNCFERLMIFRWIIKRFASQIEVKPNIINIQNQMCLFRFLSSVSEREDS